MNFGCTHIGLIYKTCCEAHSKNPELATQCDRCKFAAEIDACVRGIAPCRQALTRYGLMGEDDGTNQSRRL